MLEGLAPKEKEALCYLMKKASELSSDDLKILMDALADPRWSSNALTTALRERGFVIHRGAVNMHRKKTCSCAF